MKRVVLCGVMACALACASVVQAEQKKGIYMAGSGAWTTVSDDLKLTDLEGENGGSLPDQTLTLDDGYAIIAAVGYDFGQFRLEGEFGYRDNDVEQLKVGNVVSNGSADFQAYSIMVNAIVDVPLGERFFLYGGIGAGTVVADIDTETTFVDTEIIAGALAYQLMIGGGINLNEHTCIYVGYRLFSAFDADFDNDNSNDDDDDDSNNDDIEGTMDFPVFHSVELGMRYTF